MTENIAEPLLKWYDKNKRILPWRDKDNAYYTWVSEIMLQQTRVEAVKPYFARFIQKLPDVAALAAAPEERIVKLRVYARLTENRGDIMKQSVRKAVENELTEWMPKDRPGDFNQAMMELGAVVCVPNGTAKCEECPLGQFCLARKHGTVEELPVKAPKKARTIEQRTVLVIQEGASTAIRKRPDTGLLAGLYELPNVEGHLTQKAALAKVKDMGLEPLRIEALPDAKHIFSHIEWRMCAYRIAVSSLEEAPGEKFLFADKRESDKKYAIPSAFRAYTRYMKEENS